MLDVAADNAFRVRGIERVGNPDSQIQHVLKGQLLAGDAMVEGFAFQIRHDDEGLAVAIPDFVDGTDIGVV